MTVLCATLSGVAGTIYMSRFGAATPTFGVGHGAQHHRRGGDRRRLAEWRLGHDPRWHPRHALLRRHQLADSARRFVLLQDMIKGLHTARRRLIDHLMHQAEGHSDMANAKPKSQSAPREEIVIARQMHQALYCTSWRVYTGADRRPARHLACDRQPPHQAWAELGLVEIKINVAGRAIVEIEDNCWRSWHPPRGRRADGLGQSPDRPAIGRRSRGTAHAEQIADGDTICITGGKG